MCEHHNLFDVYYNKIIGCISCATENVIPPHSVHNNQHNIPGWTEYVAEKHDIARHAFLNWVHDGKPKYGPSYICIKAEPPLSKPCDIVNDIKNKSRLMAWLLVIATCMLSSFGMM